MDVSTSSTATPSPPPARVAIIGGGFTGAAVALNLLRDLPKPAASITIIEPRGTLGAGLAYSTDDAAHRVNVAASRLLVLPEAPGAFDNWLRTSGALDNDPSAALKEGRIYPQRAVFGFYVDRLLRRAAAAPDAAPFAHVMAKAERVEEQDGGGNRIVIDDGSVIEADFLVLAVTHPPPAVPKPLRVVARNPKFVADPWADDFKARLAPEDRVLIIGTALTAADVVSTLHNNGHRGEIVAISRRGLLSRQREITQPEPFGDFNTQPSRSCLALLKKVRHTIREAQKSFSCWEAVVDALRCQGNEIWAALPEAEKSRFLRHLRPFWDAHRYQLAPQPAATIAARCEAGQLHLMAARILHVSGEGGRFRVVLRRRNEPADDVEMFDAIINCTGPDHATITSTNPVLASLAEVGALTADPFGLGVRTDATARVIGADHRSRQNIFVAGPLARAAFGELMGLPQVTLHAALVAREICAAVATGLFLAHGLPMEQTPSFAADAMHLAVKPINLVEV